MRAMSGIVNKFEIANHGEDWLNCVCDTCGRRFHDKPSHVAKCKTHYCCKECQRLARMEYMKGEGNHQYGLKGKKNASWKSDTKISQYGYIQVHVLDHPFRDKKGFVLEHRLVAEKYLLNDENSVEIKGKRYLKQEYEVHHVNFDRKDNRVENLMVVTRKEHKNIHNTLNPNEHDASTGRIIKGEHIAKRTSFDAIIPTKVRSDIPIYDVYSRNTDDIVIPPNEIGIIPTGETFELKKDEVGAIYFRHGVEKEQVFNPHNCVNAILSDEKGEIIIPIENKSNAEMVIKPHEKVGYMVISKVKPLSMEIERA